MTKEEKIARLVSLTSTLAQEELPSVLKEAFEEFVHSAVGRVGRLSSQFVEGLEHADFEVVYDEMRRRVLFIQLLTISPTGV